MTDEPIAITMMLNRAAGGDRDAAEHVFSRIYGELRRLASIQRARLPQNESLTTTALVNEAYVRLMGGSGADWNGRKHFYCSAARAMRCVLVDSARRRSSLKRGGDRVRVDVDRFEEWLPDARPEEVVNLDLALAKLEQAIPEDFQIVMLRYFAGLTMSETADVLGQPLRSVERRWQFCRAWLRRELAGDPEGGAGT